MTALKKPVGERKDAYVLARLTRKEHKDVMALARSKRVPIADVIRAALKAWLAGKSF